MSVQAPLLQTIEPDDPSSDNSPSKPNAAQGSAANSGMASNPSDAESGTVHVYSNTQGLTCTVQPSPSAHPAVLFCMYFFRVAAVAVYILCGLFTDNYVLSTVMVVVLLAMDFWNCRNVAGRRLVGLRFWNQIDEDGDSFWVFESRDPSRPANAVDSKMFWIAIYAFPVFWLLLFVISIVRFNLSFIPIVILALVFNITNAVGFTYA
ncbi:hypothetical protein ID866_5480 [Astraeus odoratus]|nr:hypothetical protein ID866_5480 [Astraeus odoratus]